MPADIRIHIEGDPKLLPGFRQFLDELYGRGPKIDLAMCKANAIADFMSSVKKFPDAINVLLIDSEGPYTAALLQQVRQHDHWNTAVGSKISHGQLHLMVQVMESWFLADRQALQAYYGQGLNENSLPGSPSAVEQVRKDDVLNGLSAATSNTSKGKYHKTRHAPDLLKSIDPFKVRYSAPSCARLFDYLGNFVAHPTNP
jgi:hypothetical protein